MAKPRILVVEDGAVAAAVIKSDLEEIGYAVGQAVATGEEAVERAESERPDLILMDIFLAGEMDGIEAADQIRKRLDIPVVFLTAHADGELFQRAKITAPYGYLVKPFQVRELHATVEMALYRAQMEEALRASEEKFRAIAATAQDAIIMIEAEGKISYWNEAAESIFGYSKEETRGQDIHELLVPEPYLTQYRRAFPRFQETGQGAAVGRILELSAVRKGGEEFPVELSLSAVFLDGKWQAIGIIRDITERKRAEEARQRLASIVESADEAIISFTLEGLILSWNKGAERTFGYPEEEALGESVLMLVPPDRAEEASAVFEKIKRGQSVDHFETVRQRKDGALINVSLAVSPLKAADRIIGAFAIIRDISERKRAEEELKAAKEGAEAANQAKSEFLARMSHELRTPMNAIMGMTELALKTQLDEQQQDYLGAVKEASGSLLTLVTDILDFSKIEADRLELEETPFALRDLLAATIEAMKSKSQEKGLALECHIEEGIPDHFQGDPHRLDQVLVNLLGNAIKFTQEGGVHLRVEEEGREGEAVLLHFSVADTGIGIPPDKLDIIFESFTQADGSSTRRFGGTGLGTTISKQLVEMMGGVIWAESQPDQGSTFHFTIPLSLAPPP